MDFSSVAAAAAATDGLDDGSVDGPRLGSDPEERRRKRDGHAVGSSVFHIPDEAEILKKGEQTVQWVTQTITWLQTEGNDIRRGALVIGTVAEALPLLSAAFEKYGIAVASVEGLWVVPPFIVKGVDGPGLRWHNVRARLAPFLKNNLWPRIDGDARSGCPIDWRSMGLTAEHLVVVRHRRSWAELATVVARQASWTGTKRVARTAYSAATVDNARMLLVCAWPYRWSWLVAWSLVNVLICSTLMMTSSVVPIVAHDVLMLGVANAMGIGYALRFRADADAALAEADACKNAGSMALRRNKFDVAVEQYLHGELAAAKVDSMWYLNHAFRARSAPLRVACLNNAAIVRLKEKDWRGAAELCQRAVELSQRKSKEVVALALGVDEPQDFLRMRLGVRPEVGPLLTAKAHFRHALACAKLGEVASARSALLAAHALAPNDTEIVGMLQVLEWGEARRAASQLAEVEVNEVDEMEAVLRAPAPAVAGPAISRAAEAARATAAYVALTDPYTEMDTSTFCRLAPPAVSDEHGEQVVAGGELTPASAVAAIAAAHVPAAVRPAEQDARLAAGTMVRLAPRVLKFVWAKEWLSAQLVGLAVMADDGDFVGIDALTGFAGEAYVQCGASAHGRITRSFDLRFELHWQARIGQDRIAGKLSFDDMSLHLPPEDYEVHADFEEGSEIGTADCSGPYKEPKTALIQLLGPLRVRMALEADGRLSQLIWRRLLAFRSAFEAIDPSDEVTPVNCEA